MSLKVYAVNTMWLAAEKVIRMFISLFVGVWIIRHLGPQEFGALAYSVNYVLFFSAIATLGLEGVVVRELIKTPEKKVYLLSSKSMRKLSFVSLL